MKVFIVVVLMALCHPAFSKVISSIFEDQEDDRPVLAKRSGEGQCSATGDPHYNTFDGKYYNFMGACRYVMTTDSCDFSGHKYREGHFKVIQENVKCGAPSCTTAVYVTIGGETIHLQRGTTSPAPITTSKYSVTLEGGYIVVRGLTPEAAGLTVKWDMSMGLYITLDQKFRGKVCGLCGNFNGNQGDDFTMSSGGITGDASTFGNSWRSGGKCPGPAPIPQHPCDVHPNRRADAITDCSVITSDHFQSCKGSLDLEKLYDNCVYDVCSGTSVTMKDSSCEAIKTASEQCKQKTGEGVSWGHLTQKCSCQRKAIINGKTECCHFPFETSGVTFYDCVPQVHNGRPWCSSASMGTWKTVGECI